MLSNDTPVIMPSTIDVPAGKNWAHTLAIDAVGALGKSPTMAASISESTNIPPPPSFSSSADISVQPLHGQTQLPEILLAGIPPKFEQVLKEITPSLSESLGTLNELKK